VAVELAKPVRTIPSATALPGGCLYEPKWDGYRLVVVRAGDSTRVWSKQGRDLTDRFPDVVAAAVAQVPAGTVLDGEVVVWSGSRLDFGLLQQRMVTAPGRIAALGFYGANLRVGYGSLGGWDPFGPERLITRSRGAGILGDDRSTSLARDEPRSGDRD
jgi:hypothetical protein